MQAGDLDALTDNILILVQHLSKGDIVWMLDVQNCLRSLSEFSSVEALNPGGGIRCIRTAQNHESDTERSGVE